MINCFGWIIGIALRALTLGDGDSMVFLPLLLMLPIALMAVIVHEGGHYLAARNAGMTVLQWALLGWIGSARPWLAYSIAAPHPEIFRRLFPPNCSGAYRGP